MAQRVIILDRDGTINVDHGYVSRQEDWQLLVSVVAALKKLQQAGWQLAVATNQSGIATGTMARQDVQHLHRRMRSELEQHAIESGSDCLLPPRQRSWL